MMKLFPTVHFINSSYYHWNKKNRITKLYDRTDAEVTNPLLLHFNIDNRGYDGCYAPYFSGK